MAFREEENQMKPATAALDDEQKQYLSKLHLVVSEINAADDLLAKNTGLDIASRAATALLLSAIAKVLVLDNAE